MLCTQAKLAKLEGELQKKSSRGWWQTRYFAVSAPLPSVSGTGCRAAGTLPSLPPRYLCRGLYPGQQQLLRLLRQLEEVQGPGCDRPPKGAVVVRYPPAFVAGGHLEPRRAAWLCR